MFLLTTSTFDLLIRAEAGNLWRFGGWDTGSALDDDLSLLASGLGCKGDVETDALQKH